jgi:membrane-anchored glycerophosphoryl diester phosphodiesterase (GDPDase)
MELVSSRRSIQRDNDSEFTEFERIFTLLQQFIFVMFVIYLYFTLLRVQAPLSVEDDNRLWH